MVSELLSRIPPKSLNGIMMWVISFLMLFLIIKKYEKAKEKKKKFWNKEDFVENFVILFVFFLTIITFFIYIFIIGNSNKIEQPTHLLIPATVYSIILSIIALGVFLSSIFYYNSQRKAPQIRKFLFSILIVLFLVGIKKINQTGFIPYGTLFISIVTFILDICIFGILIPYIFMSVILYILKIIKEK